MYRVQRGFEKSSDAGSSVGSDSRGLTWYMGRVGLRRSFFYNVSNSEGQSKGLADNPQAKTNLVTKF